MPSPFSTSTPPEAAAAGNPLSRDVLKKVLPNGLTLLVKAVRNAPVVAVNAWVKVGSVHERDEERGITHFIEHMLFKGTERLKVGELDRLIKSAGGYNNAHTRYESTDFIDILPAEKLSVGLETMADALQHSAFDPGELGRERQVVLEELSRAQDNPGFEAWNRMTHLAFHRHPYQFPVIGYKDRLTEMDRGLLVGYWKRWYQPQNIVVVVVGDVDAPEALAQAEARFGPWSATRDVPAQLPGEPAQEGLRFEEASGDIEGTIAVLGLPSCAELDADAPALDMALAVLGQGLSSRLNLEVREKRKLVHSVAAGQFSGAYPGLAYLWAELEPGRIKPALQALWAEVERMRREPVSQADLARQRARLEHDEASEGMSMEGMAGKLGYYESLGSDYRLADTETDRLRAVGPEDVRRAMQKYFRVSAVNLVIYRSDKAPASGLDAAGARILLDKASLAPLPAPARPRAAARAQRALGRPEPGGLTRFRLSGGGTLLVKPVHHTPLVAAQMVFQSGQMAEPAAQSGALNLLARTLFKGVPGQDAAALARAMDDLGMGLGASADADRFSVSLQTLSAKVAEALALAGRSVREAELPEPEIAKERARVLKDIKDKRDAPDDFVSDLFHGLHFGAGHPYGRPLEGEAATVRRLKRRQLSELKRRILRGDRMLAVVVGDIAPARALELFEAEFGAKAWPPARGAARALPKAPALKPGPRRKEAWLPKKQAHLILGWPAPKVTDPDYPVLRLVNSVLGEGMDSRLFTEVRDKRGLCYSVYSTFDRRLNPGSWRIYVGTQPATLRQAEEVCREVAGAVARLGITAEELASAKAYAKGIFQVARQDFGTDARVIANYESWGLGAAEVERVAAKLDAVTLADCRRVAKKWLRPEQAVVAVVRPKP